MRSPVSFCFSAVAAAAHALNHPLLAPAEYLHLEDRGARGPIPTRCCEILSAATAPAVEMAVVPVAAVVAWAAAAAAATATTAATAATAAATTAASMVTSTAAAAPIPVLVSVPGFPSPHHPGSNPVSFTTTTKNSFPAVPCW